MNKAYLLKGDRKPIFFYFIPNGAELRFYLKEFKQTSSSPLPLLRHIVAFSTDVAPIKNCGIMALLGLPLGIIVAFSSGSLLTGFVSMITVVLVVMLACRKDVIRDCRDCDNKNTHSPK